MTSSISQGIAATPRPPYYAVIFTSLRTDKDFSGYDAMAVKMAELAAAQPGFLGMESSRDGLGITVIIGRAWRPSPPGSAMPNIASRKSSAMRNGTRLFVCGSARSNGITAANSRR